MPRPKLIFQNRQRGGTLITAMIFATVLATALGSLLALTRQNVRAANRFFYATAVVNQAETGIENGLFALQAHKAGDTGAWNGWTLTSGTATRTFTGIAYSGGISGSVKVAIVNYATSSPTVLARARIPLSSGEVVEKWLKINFAARSLFAFGFVARDGITASGGAYFDSWNSDPDNNPATAAIPYSLGVSTSEAIIASSSTATPSISIGSADVYGKAYVGASSSAGLAMSWGGQVGPRGMSATAAYNLAPDALGTNFTSTTETVTAPSGASSAAAYVLPRSVSGPPYYISAESIGTTGTTTIIDLPSVLVEGAATLTIRGDVTLIMPSSLGTTLTVGGSGRITLDTGATLKIYTPGNINISGAGVVNPNQPKDLQIWSTRNGVSGQTITLAGSGALAGVIYAPDSTFSIPGGTHLYGAAVVGRGTFSGSGAFHFDKSLGSFGGNGSLKISSYEELNTASEQSPYATLLAM